MSQPPRFCYKFRKQFGLFQIPDIGEQVFQDTYTRKERQVAPWRATARAKSGCSQRIRGCALVGQENRSAFEPVAAKVLEKVKD